MLQFNKVVMVGLDPTIHADLGNGGAVLDMDARVERGHDGRMGYALGAGSAAALRAGNSLTESHGINGMK